MAPFGSRTNAQLQISQVDFGYRISDVGFRSPVIHVRWKSYTIKLAPFGRAFDPGIFHSLSVTVRTADKRHFDFSPLEFSEAKLEINDGLIDPHLTPAPGTAIIVLLRRGAKGNILPLLKLHLCS